MFDCQFLIVSIRARFRISGAEEDLLLTEVRPLSKITTSHSVAFYARLTIALEVGLYNGVQHYHLLPMLVSESA